MSEADLLRQRAENLLAMAIRAREQGEFANADSLLAEAAQFINEADALDLALVHSDRQSEEIPEPARRQQPDRPEKKE
jgi:cellobiose-specific phosphotransferase system component IIA